MNARLRECLRQGVAPQLLHAACCAHKGGSSSANATTSNNIDKRLVVDSGLGVSADSSTLTLTTLDGGAIGRAFDFAESADALQGQTVQQLLGLVDRVFENSFDVLDKNSEIVKTSGAMVATAYDNAKGEGDAKRLVAYGVIAAVAIVAVRSFGKAR